MKPPGSCAVHATSQPIHLDPDGVWKRAVKSLASSFGIAESWLLVEEHADRAEARWYCGESIDEACAHAYEDIRERLVLKAAA
jgi:2-hydroxy-3-keto-5-methylthiopentenyl-1-phosphate phosphatase